VGEEKLLAPDLDARLREELGMPFLPTVFTLLSKHERYLRGAVDAFLAGPPAAIEEYGLRARRIGSEVAAAIVNTPWQTGTSARPIEALIDAYNQVNPPSLLFTLFLARGPAWTFRVMDPPLPEPPSGHDGDALLADVRACHGGFNIPGFWRELEAGWPDHVASAWALVRSLPASAGFSRARAALSSLAMERTVGATAPTPSQLGCSGAHAADIAKVLAFYAIVIPTMVIEIECLRHALALGAGDVSPGRGR